jgi:hypothetical protein
MPPIQIHRDAPIAPTAAKPDGTTPQTAVGNPAPTRTVPASVPATQTATAASSYSNPPAPQPGARPTPTTAAYPATHDASSPPAPQPGYTAHHITTATVGPPPQFTQAPPSDAHLAGRSTVTATTPSKPGPTTLNFGPVASPFQSADAYGAAPAAAPTGDAPRRSLEHPPGYQQAPDNAPYTAGGGIGGGMGGGDTGAEGAGIGATAWSMLSKAGDALKKGEEAAWKAINGK